jgi:tripartite-type tricarboxylate transporter receptor subunit TctC
MIDVLFRHARRASALGAFALGLAAASGLAKAQDYPNKPIRVVVPNPPGGMTDLLARVLADKLGALYNQTIVVENRAGASGHIAGQQVARAPSDGYTILVGTIGIHAAHASYRKLAYDPAGELQVVTILAESPNVVVVPAASPIKTFRDLLARAKADPASLNYATAGAGSSVHMVTALFEVTSGTKVSYVPYKGSGPAMVDLIGGQVQVMFENLPTGLPHIQSGKVRALAVTGATRDSRLPDVPTIAEAGLPGYAGLSWWTVAVPRGTPPALVDKLGRDTQRVLGTPEVTALLDKQGVTLVLNTPTQANEFVKRETTKWNRVIQATNMSVE